VTGDRLPRDRLPRNRVGARALPQIVALPTTRRRATNHASRIARRACDTRRALRATRALRDRKLFSLREAIRRDRSRDAWSGVMASAPTLVRRSVDLRSGGPGARSVAFRARR
jgi:hypothetical protein